MPFGVNLFTYPNQPSLLMLNQLTIRNYVLVDHLDIDFAPGLTGITGESGAGKSILLGALGLLMGERARTDSPTRRREGRCERGIWGCAKTPRYTENS